MSFNISSTRTPPSQGTADVAAASADGNVNGNGCDSWQAPAHNKLPRLGNFDSIFDWLGPTSEGTQLKESDKAGRRSSAAALAATPTSPSKIVLLRRTTASPTAAPPSRVPSSGAYNYSPYKAGLMKGFTYPGDDPHSGSASSTPMPPGIVSEGDSTSDDDDNSDVVSLGSTVGGLPLNGDGETELRIKQIDAQWSSADIKIASASTSPATAIERARAAVRTEVEKLSFVQTLPSPRIAASNTTTLSRQPYPGQPSPAAVVLSPRRTKLSPVVPHHRKTVSDKLYLAKKLLHIEYALDQKIASTADTSLEPVHVIVDMSNIVIGFYETIKARHKLQGRYASMPFSFEVLNEIMLRGRSFGKLVAAGSTKDTTSISDWPSHMATASKLGYDMNVLRRVKDQTGESFKEQGVDELLHLKMCQCIIDFEPATLILATGDANVAEFSDGFLKNVKRALKCGWRVELYSWRLNISKAWKDLYKEQKNPDDFRIIVLDKYADFLLGENPNF